MVYMLYEHILQAFLWLVNKKIAKGMLYLVFGRMRGAGLSWGWGWDNAWGWGIAGKSSAEG